MTEPEHACSYCDPYNFAAFPWPPDEEMRERHRVHGDSALSTVESLLLLWERAGVPRTGVEP